MASFLEKLKLVFTNFSIVACTSLMTLKMGSNCHSLVDTSDLR